MNKNFITKYLITLGLLLFFTFLPQIIPTQVSIAQASEIEKEKNNDYRLNLRNITLVNGKSFTLKVFNLEKDANVTFRSADSEIASINENGTLTANKVGSTTITATIKLGSNSTPTLLTCEVTVGPPAFSVKMTRSMLILGLDQSFQLEAVLKPANTVEPAKFFSNDSTIASVSPGGRVTGKKAGMTYVFAEIDATTQNGNRKLSPCSVIVSNEKDATLLMEYFSNHAELSLLSEAELSSALFDFFNPIETALDTTKSSETSTSTKTNDTSKTSGNELSFVESLDKHLKSRFDLARIKQRYEERFQPRTEVQLSSLYGNTIKR